MSVSCTPGASNRLANQRSGLISICSRPIRHHRLWSNNKNNSVLTKVWLNAGYMWFETRRTYVRRSSMRREF